MGALAESVAAGTVAAGGAAGAGRRLSSRRFGDTRVPAPRAARLGSTPPHPFAGGTPSRTSWIRPPLCGSWIRPPWHRPQPHGPTPAAEWLRSAPLPSGADSRAGARGRQQQSKDRRGADLFFFVGAPARRGHGGDASRLAKAIVNAPRATRRAWEAPACITTWEPRAAVL